MAEPITQFDPDPDRLIVIRECMENCEVGAPEVEWPSNIVSRKSVVYDSHWYAISRLCMKTRVGLSFSTYCCLVVCLTGAACGQGKGQIVHRSQRDITGDLRVGAAAVNLEADNSMVIAGERIADEVVSLLKAMKQE